MLDSVQWPDLVRAMAVEDLGPDFSGIRAHATLEIHMKECTERQAELRAGMMAIHSRLDQMGTSFDKRMSEMQHAVERRAEAQEMSSDRRMTSISNRMWATAIGVIVMLIGTVAFLIPHYVGK